MNDLPRTQALRCFITVAREGTVSRAASLLNLTQPAVSLQLKGLGRKYRTAAFHRTPGGFTLTEAGAALLPLAHKAVSATSDFRTMADSLKESQRGTLRVGTILDPEFTRLGPFVRSLAKSHRTEVFLRYGMSDDVLTQIGKGELDVGYYVDATPPEQLSKPPFTERKIEGGKFQLVPLLTYDYRIIAPDPMDDRVMGKDWADLALLPWLTTPPASAHRRRSTHLPAARSVAEARRLYRSGRGHDRLRRIRRLPQPRPRRRARTAAATQAELRDRRQGGADLRPQPGLPDIAAA